MAEFVAGRSQPEPDPEQVKEAVAEAVRPLRREDGENIHAIRREIEDLMWAQGGVVRDGPGLESAITSLDDLDERAGRAPVPPLREYNLAWQEWLNVQNILTVARLTCQSALARRESRGSHYRSDHPDTDNREWLCNILVRRDPDGEPRVWSEKAKLTRLQPGPAASPEMNQTSSASTS
jgi:succinate dehydrogenase/fumarate reductase flavoprotein subunit